MSSVRTLKIRRSVPTEAESQPAGSSTDAVVSRSIRSEKSGAQTAPGIAAAASQPIPLEPPYDRQSIIRFPADVADRIRKILGDSGTTELTEVIRIQVENRPIAGHQFRLYSMSVYEHQRHLKNLDMKGILVDLPTFVESYKTVNNGVTITKSADVSQMLVCFKVSEFDLDSPSPELQKALTLLYPSGITPPTSRIRYRKFRLPPTPEDIQNLRSAEDLIDSVMSGGALEWVIENEVDEDEAVQRAINEPETVWTPTEEVLRQLRQAGYIDENGDIIAGDDDQDMREQPGGKAISLRGKF